jgi:hypothetical protein
MVAGRFVRSPHDAPCGWLGISGDYLVEGEDSPSRFCLILVMASAARKGRLALFRRTTSRKVWAGKTSVRTVANRHARRIAAELAKAGELFRPSFVLVTGCHSRIVIELRSRRRPPRGNLTTPGRGHADFLPPPSTEKP